MERPQRDVPVAVVRSAVTGVLLYAIPIFAIILALATEKVTGIGGFIDAVSETSSVYGGAQDVPLGVMTLCFVGTLLTAAAVWMIGSDRILAVAAYDGGFPAFFGKFNPSFGTPVRVNVMSGIVATAFTIAAVAAFSGGTNSKFVVVLDIAISTTLISYPWIFPSAAKLRHASTTSTGPTASPTDAVGCGSRAGRRRSGLRWAAGSPSSPARSRSCSGSSTTSRTSGVSRATFKALTLGTLAVIPAIALVGYARSRDVRERAVEIALETDATVRSPAT